jgi:16S rRNA C967 or C1407 C5-methylase (RsmB/RsmF family)
MKSVSGWSSHFEKQYGEERWKSLSIALKKPSSHVSVLVTPAAHYESKINEKCQNTPIDIEVAADENSIPTIEYFLDLASAVCALSVPLKLTGPSKVLDVCAAPGGKSLILAQRLFASHPDSLLHCNEVSSSRLIRLKKTLSCFRPKMIKFSHLDATSNFPETYDAILVDAPCSSDRHTLGTGWSIGVVKSNTERQYKILTLRFG